MFLLLYIIVITIAVGGRFFKYLASVLEERLSQRETQLYAQLNNPTSPNVSKTPSGFNWAKVNTTKSAQNPMNFDNDDDEEEDEDEDSDEKGEKEKNRSIATSQEVNYMDKNDSDINSQDNNNNASNNNSPSNFSLRNSNGNNNSNSNPRSPPSSPASKNTSSPRSPSGGGLVLPNFKELMAAASHNGGKPLDIVEVTESIKHALQNKDGSFHRDHNTNNPQNNNSNNNNSNNNNNNNNSNINANSTTNNE